MGLGEWWVAFMVLATFQGGRNSRVSSISHGEHVDLELELAQMLCRPPFRGF